MSLKYFGTDGIRRRVGCAEMNPDFAMRIGVAVGRYLRASGFNSKVVIGRDTRESGVMLQQAMQAGLLAQGFEIVDLQVIPTPAIAYFTCELSAAVGIVISASHNPYYDNGIKFFNHQGKKFLLENERLVEALIDEPIDWQNSHFGFGAITGLNSAIDRYRQACLATVPDLSLSGLNIVLDCANGATYQVAPQLFEHLGATVIPMFCGPNGQNINDGCGATQLQALQQMVQQQSADLGIALDGDGDRLMLIDHEGTIADGDDVLALLATHPAEETVAVVGTRMTNLGVEHYLQQQGVQLLRSAVGDRCVMQLMSEQHCWLGAEPSGHVIDFRHATTGDGLIAALQVLSVLQQRGESLSQCCSRWQKYPSALINVPAASIVYLRDYPAIIDLVAETEARLGSQARVVVRASGTEPCVRVMVEGQQASQVKQEAEKLAQSVQRLLTQVSARV